MLIFLRNEAMHTVLVYRGYLLTMSDFYPDFFCYGLNMSENNHIDRFSVISASHVAV